MGKTKVKLHNKGFNQLRKSPEILAACQGVADRIVSEATTLGQRPSLSGTDTVYETEVRRRKSRNVVIVRSASWATTAVNVGRGRSKTVGSKGRGVTRPLKDLLRAMDSV